MPASESRTTPSPGWQRNLRGQAHDLGLHLLAVSRPRLPLSAFCHGPVSRWHRRCSQGIADDAARSSGCRCSIVHQHARGDGPATLAMGDGPTFRCHRPPPARSRRLPTLCLLPVDDNVAADAERAHALGEGPCHLQVVGHDLKGSAAGRGRRCSACTSAGACRSCGGRSAARLGAACWVAEAGSAVAELGMPYGWLSPSAQVSSELHERICVFYGT